MKRPKPTNPICDLKSIASRGDLLRMLQMQDKTTERVAGQLGVLAGYQHEPVEDDEGEPKTKIMPGEAVRRTVEPESADKKKPVTQRRPEVFYYVSERKKHPVEPPTDDPEDSLPQCLQHVKPIADEELKQWTATQVEDPPYPIAPASRMQPFLTETLSQLLGKQLDVKKLVRQVSELSPLYRLPTSNRKRMTGRVCVVVDYNERIKSFWPDMRELIDEIVTSHGVIGLKVRQLCDEPGGETIDGLKGYFETNPEPWRVPDSETTVLILSDLGQIDTYLSDAARGAVIDAWIACGQAYARAGIKPLVLAPVAACQVLAVCQRWYHIIPWNKHSRLLPQPRQANDAVGCGKRLERQADELLVLLSPAVYIERPLLRAIAALQPDSRANSGLLAAVWNHPQVTGNVQECTIDSVARQAYQQRFKALDVRLQKRVLLTLKKHHEAHFPTVWSSELIQAESFYQGDIDQLGSVAQAADFMNRLARTVHEAGSHAGLLDVARTEALRQNTRSRQAHDYTTVLYGYSHRDALQQGDGLLSGTNPVVLQQLGFLGDRKNPLRAYTLIQRHDQLMFMPVEAGGGNESTNGFTVNKPLAQLAIRNDIVLINRGGQLSSLNLSQPQAMTEAVRLSLQLRSVNQVVLPSLQLDTGHETLTLRSLNKSRSHVALGYAAEGLYQTYLHNDRYYTAYWQAPEAEGWGYWNHLIDFAEDDYGRYAILRFKHIEQRFRWIEAGMFVMGSPESEKGRESHESRKGSETQHEVTLSQGYWLADTTVTQAFWAAIMDDNPSHFTAAETKLSSTANHPVEQVSWDDCQAFIKRLTEYFPMLEVRLPREAEWEYACRAGTTTSFHFGEVIDSKQVNYGDTFDGSDYGKQALKRTAPVKSYPANDWGLYEMHGNVWEWCQDYWQQKQSNQAVTDPQGSQEGAERVLRGGSWDSGGRNVRSAFRSANSPVKRDSRIGLRLALGHSASLQDAFSIHGNATDRRESEAATVSSDAGNAADKVQKSQNWFDRLLGRRKES